MGKIESVLYIVLLAITGITMFGIGMFARKAITEKNKVSEFLGDVTLASVGVMMIALAVTIAVEVWL